MPLTSIIGPPVEPERKFLVSKFANRHDNEARPAAVVWSVLKAALSSHERRPEKDGRLFSPAIYHPPALRRCNGNVLGISLAVLDIESHGEVDVTTETLVLLADRLKESGLAFILATTHSHRPDVARARLVLAPDRDLTTDEAWPVLAALGDLLDIPVDAQCKDPARVFYLPAAAPGAQAFAASADGSTFSVSKALELAAPKPVACACSPAASSCSSAIVHTDARGRALAYSRAYPPAIEGQGGDLATYTLCCAIARGFDLSEDDALDVLGHWNACCSPPWEESDLRAKIRAALRNGTEPVGGRLAVEMEHSGPAPVPDSFLDVDPRTLLAKPTAGHQKGAGREPGCDDGDGGLSDLEQAIADLDARSGSSYARTLEFECAADLLHRDIPKPLWLIDGILPDVAVAAIAGEPKTTKTWAGLELGVALASGTNAFGEFRIHRKRSSAFFLAEDSDRSVRARLRSLCAGRGIDAAETCSKIHVICRGSMDLGQKTTVASLIAAVRRLPEPIGLLVLDPLRDLHMAEENDSGEMAHVMAQLRALRDVLGCTVAFVHHTGKQGQATEGRRSGQRMRGSSAVHGAIDSGFYMGGLETDNVAHWGSDVEIEIKAGRGAGKFSVALDVTDDDNGEAAVAVWSCKTGSDKSTDMEANILQTLSVDIPASTDAVAAAVGIRKAAVISILKSLGTKGLARCVMNGKRPLGWLKNGAVPSRSHGGNDSPGVQAVSVVPSPLGRERLNGNASRNAKQATFTDAERERLKSLPNASPDLTPMELAQESVDAAQARGDSQANLDALCEHYGLPLVTARQDAHTTRHGGDDD